MIRGQFLLSGERKTPRKILQTGHGGIEPGKLLLVKGVARQDGPEQLAQLRELAGCRWPGGWENRAPSTLRRGFANDGLRDGGGGRLGAGGAGLKNVTRQPPVAASTMPK